MLTAPDAQHINESTKLREAGELRIKHGKPGLVSVDSLNIDTSYQSVAPRSARLVAEIGKGFSSVLVGRLHVVRRVDGTLYIADGRHRWEGAKLAKVEKVPVDIYEVVVVDNQIRT